MSLHIPNHPPQPAHTDVDRFWEFTAAGEIRLPRCGTCGRWLPVGTLLCPIDNATPQWQLAPRTGRIFTYTVVHRGFLPPESAAVPYAVALVELDGVEHVRLLAPVAAEAAEEVEVGATVHIDLCEFPTHRLPVARLARDSTA